jgi:flagellar basal-body rod protein FlgB
MNFGLTTQLSDEIARYLDLSTAQAKLTAANMANIDTPGYQAVGFNFAAEMQQAIQSAGSRDSAQPIQVHRVDGLVARPDGNNVSMDRESLNLAEAQLQFRTGVTLLKQEYQRVMDAIHADKQ